MRIISSLFVVFFFFLGCASTIVIQSVEPNFNASETNKKMSNKIKIAIAAFDAKSDVLKKNIIGEAKTGLLNDIVPIVSIEPISSIVHTAIERGFENYGFIITGPQSADYVIEGAIEKFWVDEYATGFSIEYSRAYVRYDVLIKTANGEIIWANTQEKFKTSSKSFDTTEDNLPTLTIALQNSIESIFIDDSFWIALQNTSHGQTTISQ